LKQSVPNAHNETKLALEGKLKSNFCGQNHEVIFKNDGTHSHELKSDILERKTNIKGLKLAYKSLSHIIPTDKAPEHKLGLDFANDKIKFKWY